MAIAITIPRLGWNMEEGIFVGWLKSDGEHRGRAASPFFSLEGDKATQDIESLEAGILRHPARRTQGRRQVAVGALIGYLVAPGEPAPFEVGSVNPTRQNRRRASAGGRACRARDRRGSDGAKIRRRCQLGQSLTLP